MWVWNRTFVCARTQFLVARANKVPGNSVRVAQAKAQIKQPTHALAAELDAAFESHKQHRAEISGKDG